MVIKSKGFKISGGPEQVILFEENYLTVDDSFIVGYQINEELFIHTDMGEIVVRKDFKDSTFTGEFEYMKYLSKGELDKLFDSKDKIVEFIEKYDKDIIVYHL